jgi:hypothetical protein
MFEPWVERLYDSSESRPLGFTNHIVFTSPIFDTGLFAGVKTDTLRQLSRVTGVSQPFLQALGTDVRKADFTAKCRIICRQDRIYLPKSAREPRLDTRRKAPESSRSAHSFAKAKTFAQRDLLSNNVYN